LASSLAITVLKEHISSNNCCVYIPSLLLHSIISNGGGITV